MLPDLSHLSDSDRLRRVGSADQLDSLRRMRLTEGPGEGLELIELITAAGLRAVFCPNRALDLVELNYRGVNIGFWSKNGLQSGRVPAITGEFRPTWPGGMLVTCGLRNTGTDCTVDGEYHPMHGRISGQPAEHVCCSLDRQGRIARIAGDIRESALFGYNLLLRRDVTVDLDRAVIRWHDIIENQTPEDEQILLLYHVNFGYPFLDPDLQLHVPPGVIRARSEFARQGLDEFDRFSDPLDGREEQCYFHQPNRDLLPGKEGDRMSARLVRPKLRMQAELRWSRAELPVLVEWKSMRSGDYALGIEPGTSEIRGRAEELKAGYNYTVPAFGKREFHLELELSTLA